MNLPGLRPREAGTSDLVIEIDDALPARRAVAHRWQGHYGLALEHDQGRWVIRKGEMLAFSVDPAGTHILCHCPDRTDLPFLEEILIRRVLPRVAALHGRLVIHAATLGDEDEAVMLFGASGAGKSTMTAAMSRAFGWSVFADDMSVLDVTDEGVGAWPALARISLRPGSQRGLAVRDAECEPLRSHEGKKWYAPASAAAPGQRALKAIIFLSLPDDPKRIDWLPLAGPEVLVMAASQLVRFNPGDVGEASKAMAQLKNALGRVPTYALTYPREFALLPDVLAAIRTLCDHAAHASV